MMIQIPKTMTASKVTDRDEWFMYAGDTHFGTVTRDLVREGTTQVPVYTFRQTHEKLTALPPVKARTMKALKEDLTRRIPRDTYIAILEENPQ